MVQVLFFGKLGDLIGRSVPVDAEPATVGDLRRALIEAYPHAAGELKRPSLRACIGDELVGEDQPLDSVETVEFFPPLSGG